MELKPVTPTAKAPAEHFTGDVYVNSIYRGQDPSKMIASLVRFTPSARTNWHSHATGQTLHVTDGIGLVVTRDGTVIRMRPGDTAWTPPGEEHWHGATDGNFMCHLALLEGTGDGDGTTWLEPVPDDQYKTANQYQADSSSDRPRTLGAPLKRQLRVVAVNAADDGFTGRLVSNRPA